MFHVIYCLPVTLFHGYPDQGKLRKLAIEIEQIYYQLYDCEYSSVVDRLSSLAKHHSISD